MIKITDDMRDAIAKALDERAYCLVATADGEGWPNVSYRGSVSVYSDTELSFWNRNRTETVKAIEDNPKATIFYRNRERQANWRFMGHARIVTDEEERKRVISVTDERELKTDPELKGIGVIVSVVKVIDNTGAVVMEA